MRKKKFVFSNEPFLGFPQLGQFPNIQAQNNLPKAPKVYTSTLTSPINHYQTPPAPSLVSYERALPTQPSYWPGDRVKTMPNRQYLTGENGYKISKQEIQSPLQSLNELNTTTRLPQLSRTFNEDAHQSKLMEDIRRVQNRIKELKYERNQFSAQQNNFQTLRPFLQIQNQNMINMQMMILAQNKRPQHCCAKERENKEPKVYKQPKQRKKYKTKLKSLKSLESQHSSIKTISQAEQSEQEVKIVRKQPIKRVQKGKVQKPKKYNMRKIRKFRIAVIAVYFGLLFPKYANRFTLKRYKLHSSQFFSRKRDEQSINKSFVDEILKVNMVDVSQKIRRERLSNGPKRVDKSPKLVITQQFTGDSNFQFYIGDIEIYLLDYLKKLEEQIDDLDFQQFVREISMTCLPYSFPVDNNQTLQEIYRVRYHPQRLYMRMQKDEAKAYILVAFFIKMFLIQYTGHVKDKHDWKKKIQKSSELKGADMIKVQLATTEMYFSGIMLHSYCMDLLKEWLQTSDGNAPLVDQANLPLPIKAIYFDKAGQLQVTLGAQKKNKGNKAKQKIQTEKDMVYERLDIRQHKGQDLHKFQYIKNLSTFNGLIKMVQQTSDYQREVKERILDIVDIFYDKALQMRRDQYRNIKEELLFSEKHLLTVKVNYSGLAMPKRKQEEKKFIKQFIGIIEESKIAQSMSRPGDSAKDEKSQISEEAEEQEEDQEEEDQEDQQDQDDEEQEVSGSSSGNSSQIPKGKRRK